MKKTVLIIAIIVCCMFTGCHNTTTKNFGGSMTIELEPGQKLEEITWKDDDIWILSRPMREDEQPEAHTFYEKSEWGVFEGTVTVVEKEDEKHEQK